MAATTRGHLLDRIIARADADAGYRHRLTRDPRGVLANEMGLSIPPVANITVIEETPDTYYIVLPYRPRDGAELQDRDLERVAGGLWDKTCTGATLDTWVSVG